MGMQVNCVIYSLNLVGWINGMRKRIATCVKTSNASILVRIVMEANNSRNERVQKTSNEQTLRCSFLSYNHMCLKYVTATEVNK